MKKHVILYRNEFCIDVWEEYCDIAGVPHYAEEVTIPFDTNEVSFREEESYEEDEENEEDE